MAKSTSILKKIKRLPQQLKRISFTRDFWLVGLVLLIVIVLLILDWPLLSDEIKAKISELSFVLLGILIPLLWITGKNTNRRERYYIGGVMAISILASVIFSLWIPTINVVGNSYGGLADELRLFDAQNRGFKTKLVEDWSGLNTDERYNIFVDYIQKSGDIDIFEMDGIWMAFAIHEGLLLPLDRFYRQDMGGRSFPRAALDIARHPETGSLYGVPLYVDVGLVFYRKDLIGDFPNPVSLQDLETAITETFDQSSGKGLLGYVFQGAQYEGLNVSFFEAIFSENVEIISDNGKVRINSDVAVSVLKKLHDMIYKNGIIPPSVLLFEEEESRNIFALGRTLVLRNWPYVIFPRPRSFRVPPKDIGIASFRRPVLGGWYLGIAKSSKHPKKAWEVIKFLTSQQTQIDRAENPVISRRRIPSDIKVISDLLIRYPFLRDVERALGRAKARPRIENYHSFSKSLSSALFSVLSDPKATEKTIKVALDKVQLQLK